MQLVKQKQNMNSNLKSKIQGMLRNYPKPCFVSYLEIFYIKKSNNISKL